MNLFDGLGALVTSTFGDSAIITPKATGIPATVQGIFRFVTIEDPVADGRDLIRQVPVFRLPANVATLVRGDMVQPSNVAGRSFVVLDMNDNTASAPDNLTTYRCEEIL